jgi:hypothetical protein
VWLRLVKTKAVDPASGENERLSHLVYRACDRGFLGYEGIENGVPRLVYPYCLMQVTTARTGRLSILEAFGATWDVDAWKVMQYIPTFVAQVAAARLPGKRQALTRVESPAALLTRQV